MSRERADVVVVGAGIVGLCVAYQVARRSGLDVLVLERGRDVAEGSTGASSSIIRQRYTRDEMIRFARGGLVAFREWQTFTGLARPLGAYRPIGVLWMTGEDRTSVEADRDRLRGAGASAHFLDAAAVRERFPALSTCGVRFDWTGEEDHACVDHDAFLFEEDAGYFPPVEACRDLLEAARREGASIRFNAPVSGITSRGGRVSAVELASGELIGTDILVNAAGPWCNQLNELAGVELPWRLVPTRIQTLVRELPAEVPRPLPVVLDSVTGVYFRPETGDAQLLAGSVREADEQEAVDPDAYPAGADRAFVETRIHGVHHRIPSLPHRGTLLGYAGLYTVNRDDVHPLIGPTELDGYLVCNGFSGHGFKEAPMAGALLAAWITGRAAEFDPDVPLSFFAVDRNPIPMAEKSVLA